MNIIKKNSSFRSGLLFREAEPRDARALARIYEPEAEAGHFRHFGRDPEQIFQSMIATGRLEFDTPVGRMSLPVALFVAEKNAEIVGFYMNAPWADREKAAKRIQQGQHSDTTWDIEVWMLAVDRKFRNQGIGRACLEHQIRDAKMRVNGVGTIYARCAPVSEQAMKLLTLNGFRLEQKYDDGVSLFSSAP